LRCKRTLQWGTQSPQTASFAQAALANTVA